VDLTDFIRSECDHFREECNFTPSERAVFDMRVADDSVVKISMELNMSESAVYKRIRRIKKKINKVLEKSK
jgi:DNA-binding CsgD family transcriptional regulator